MDVPLPSSAFFSVCVLFSANVLLGVFQVRGEVGCVFRRDSLVVNDEHVLSVLFFGGSSGLRHKSGDIPGGSFRRRLRCSLLTDRCGYARRLRPARSENSSPRPSPYLHLGPLSEIEGACDYSCDLVSDCLG